MKAIIPVAGEGSKLRPHTHTQPKALVPVAGKPIIAHIVDFLIEGGIRKYVFIIGYMGHRIEEYLLKRYRNVEISMQFVVQESREGSGHALYTARQYFEQEENVLISLGDTILDLPLKKFLDLPMSAVGVSKVDKPTQFGIAELDKDGIAKRLIEKPRIPKSNLALTGIYKIMNVPLFVEGLHYLIKNEVRTQEEFHLTDALMYMLENGERFTTREVDGWYDCVKKETLLASNAKLLKRPVVRQLDVQQFPNSIIVQPVRIGPHCQISNSIIGPNVVIGDHSEITNCQISNSIIGSYSTLDSLILNQSLIGNDSSLQGIRQSLNVGDNTEIRFGS